MNMWLVGLLILVSGLAACGEKFGVYSPSQIHRTVQPHPNREGVYLVYYRFKQVIEEYGPGWEKVLVTVHQAKSNEEINTIWDKVLTLAVPKYMEEKGLIPGECICGIDVISSQMDEAGGGTTAFSCNKKVNSISKCNSLGFK